MASKYETKKLPELTSELLEMHRGKPLEWWAKQLATARKDAYMANESARTAHHSRHGSERRDDNMEIVNHNLVKLLKKAGFKLTRLRITEDWKGCKYNDGLSQEEIDDGEMCFPNEFNNGCAECEELYYRRAIQNVFTYDYDIVDGAIDAITADLKNYETGEDILLKVEDISNPQHPIVIWEAKDGN